MIRRTVLSLLGLLAAGCFRPQPATVPLRTLPVSAGNDSRCLVVFLPGRGDVPEDYVRNGFGEALRQAGSQCDMVGVDAHMGYYFEGSIVERLEQDVIGPARARGVERVWLVGISLGGLGSLLYAREHPEGIAGIVLLSPFLGTEDVTSEVAAAGGLRSWKPPQSPGERDFRGVWDWLQGYAPENGGAANRPPLYLAYGARDRFAEVDAMLAEVLPKDRVFTLPGHHTWRTWRRLWAAVLAGGVVPGATGSSR